MMTTESPEQELPVLPDVAEFIEFIESIDSGFGEYLSRKAKSCASFNNLGQCINTATAMIKDKEALGPVIRPLIPEFIKSGDFYTVACIYEFLEEDPELLRIRVNQGLDHAGKLNGELAIQSMY